MVRILTCSISSMIYNMFDVFISEGNNNSFQYIDKILGYSSSPLEWFLLKRKLLGPCWLKVKNPRTLSSSVSW